MDPVAPAARTVEFGENFAEEKSVFGSGFGQQDA
jgi:hypothetical protein